MNTLAKDFKAAFGSVWALLGVIISAVAVFNWLSGILKFGLSALFHQLLTAFRSVFHPIIEVLTSWAVPWLPFLALAELKDGLILWFAIGGGVARTFTVLTRKLNSANDLNPFDAHTNTISHFNRSPVTWMFGLLISMLAWPTMLYLFWLNPRVFLHEYASHSGVRLKHYSISRLGKTPVRKVRESSVQSVIYDHDLRIVFAMQLAAVIAVVVCLVLLNAAGVS